MVYDKAEPLNAPSWFDCFDAARIGAAVQIESRSGQGTTVTLTLPRNPVTAVGTGTAGLDFSESVLTIP